MRLRDVVQDLTSWMRDGLRPAVRARAASLLWDRLRRGDPDPVEDARQRELAGLIAEFDALPTARVDEVARATAMLWNAFVERFDGIDGFLAAPMDEQRTYVEGIEHVRGRMWPLRGSPAGHYAYATALVARYLEFWREGGVGDRATLEIGRRVVELIERGRRLGPPARTADEATAGAV